MDTNTVILVFFYAVIFVFIYRILKNRKNREEITLKDLYRTSKSQKMSIAKSRERMKREKEEFIQTGNLHFTVQVNYHLISYFANAFCFQNM